MAGICEKCYLPIADAKELKAETWLSTVSCSPFQPAMARDCPPSVSLQRTLPLAEGRKIYSNLKAATNLVTSSMFQPTLVLTASESSPSCL